MVETHSGSIVTTSNRFFLLLGGRKVKGASDDKIALSSISKKIKKVRSEPFRLYANVVKVWE